MLVQFSIYRGAAGWEVIDARRNGGGSRAGKESSDGQPAKLCPCRFWLLAALLSTWEYLIFPPPLNSVSQVRSTSSRSIFHGTKIPAPSLTRHDSYFRGTEFSYHALMLAQGIKNIMDGTDQVRQRSARYTRICDLPIEQAAFVDRSHDCP